MGTALTVAVTVSPLVFPRTFLRIVRFYLCASRQANKRCLVKTLFAECAGVCCGDDGGGRTRVCVGGGKG